MKKRIAPIEFLWFGLYAFAGFSLELILALVIDLIGIGSLGVAATAIITAVLWSVAAYFLIDFSKKNLAFDPFHVRKTPNQSALIAIAVIVVLIIIVSTIGFSGFKPLVEFNGDLKGSYLALFFRLLYYLAESALILLTIVFGQEFFERQFGVSNKIPAGGIFLAITWGLIHILLQGFTGGLFTIFFSLMAGLIYIFAGKNAYWSYFFIALAFIL